MHINGRMFKPTYADCGSSIVRSSPVSASFGRLARQFKIEPGNEGSQHHCRYSSDRIAASRTYGKWFPKHRLRFPHVIVDNRQSAPPSHRHPGRPVTVSANRLQRPHLGQHRISENFWSIASHARTAEQICKYLTIMDGAESSNRCR
jgi:hypothetical protein